MSCSTAILGLPLGLSPAPRLCPSHSPCRGGTSRLCHSILPSQVREKPAPVKPLSLSSLPSSGPDGTCGTVSWGSSITPGTARLGKGLESVFSLVEWWLHLGGVFCRAGERGERCREGNCLSWEVWENTPSRSRAFSPK